jgi:hypothetical protein
MTDFPPTILITHLVSVNELVIGSTEARYTNGGFSTDSLRAW